MNTLTQNSAGSIPLPLHLFPRETSVEVSNLEHEVQKEKFSNLKRWKNIQNICRLISYTALLLTLMMAVFIAINGRWRVINPEKKPVNQNGEINVENHGNINVYSVSDIRNINEKTISVTVFS